VAALRVFKNYVLASGQKNRQEATISEGNRIGTALDRTAILDSLFRPVTLPGLGIAISPRGDMLKNRVPVNSRTHRVGNQLNFR
jgi:hypothetical protein